MAAEPRLRQLCEISRGAPIDHNRIEQLRAATLNEDWPRTSKSLRIRVWFSVLCDLVEQGWLLELRAHRVVLVPPSVDGDAQQEKDRVRQSHLVERTRLLRQEDTRKFVREMESAKLHHGRWVSVLSLLRDGVELRKQLSVESPCLRDIVQPYLQFVDPVQVCEHTGLRLQDIWRYFRLTWTTVPQSTPGRRMMILVRDRAAAFHPVIGIAAITSPVVQLGVRDQWVGWREQEFLQAIQEKPSKTIAEWVLSGVDDMIESLYLDDFFASGLTKKELRHPSRQTIKTLRKQATKLRQAHVRYARTGGHKAASMNPETSDWKQQATTYLFRSKRALGLAKALETRLNLLECGFTKASRSNLLSALSQTSGRKAVAAVLRHHKSKHVGIDMCDISVCGAIAPYTHLLGGKLVSLMLMSPQVVDQYRSRYKGAISIIASAMKGKAVQRVPRLVMLGTTSLYGVTSSQYNRLVIREADLPGLLQGDLAYKLLGKSIGFGSYHLSSATLNEMGRLVQQRQQGRRVNFIFGEGVSPRFRLAREALDLVGLPSDAILRHRSARLVYGVSLARNFRELLLGFASRPSYYFRSGIAPEAATAAIASFWQKRWLSGRVKSPSVLDAIAFHSLQYPVRHGGRVNVYDEYEELPLFAGE
jgi:hypothetical protein